MKRIGRLGWRDDQLALIESGMYGNGH